MALTNEADIVVNETKDDNDVDDDEEDDDDAGECLCFHYGFLCRRISSFYSLLIAMRHSANRSFYLPVDCKLVN